MKNNFCPIRRSVSFQPKTQNNCLHTFTTENLCRPTSDMSPDEEPVEIRTSELRKDHSQKERTGFIAVASN